MALMTFWEIREAGFLRDARERLCGKDGLTKVDRYTGNAVKGEREVVEASLTAMGKAPMPNRGPIKFDEDVAEVWW